MRKKVFIKNKKELELAVIVERLEVADRMPLVLMFHGFKGYKDEATYSELAKMLLEINIASVRFDTSGFGDSEGDFEKEYRLSNYVSDSESVYEWIMQQDFVDKSRIGVMGQSMGGAQALIFSANHPEVEVMVSISPPDIFATKDAFGKRLKEWKKRGFIEIESSRMGKIRVPYEYVLDAKKYDIRDYARKVKGNKLFILGLEDETVDPEQTRSVFKAAGEPKRLIEVEGMDHFYKKNPEMLTKVNKISWVST